MSLSALVRFNLRYYRRRRILSVLCLLGISLGVGILVAVELINNCALASFSNSVDLLAGAATHSIVSSYGHIEEQVFVKVWEHPKVKAASPVVEVMAETVETGTEPIRFVGIDPFLDAPFRSFMPAHGTERDLVAFLASDVPMVCLSSGLMRRFGLKPGDTLTVLTAGVERGIRILGSIAPSGISESENLAVLDISGAQDLFGRTGYLDRIDIIMRSDSEGLLTGLPQTLTLTDADEKKSALKAMLYSFQLNLAAMSLLALFVGVFLIYNFSMFSVLSRRQDLSLMLTLGSDRRGLVVAFVGESMLLGTIGTLLGIGFGYFVASLSIERVSSTISELYFYINPGSVHLTLPVAATGFAVGIMATLIGSSLPALEVAVTPPILGMKKQTIEDRAHSLKALLLGSGVIFCVLAIVCAWGSRFSVFWGFASAFGMTLAFALFTPSVLSRVTHRPAIWLRSVSGSLELFLAARTIRASLSRTSIAVAALAVALSMTIGVDTMIHSFRRSVDSWLEGSLQGDIYVSPLTTKWAHPLPDSLVRALMEDPRIDAVERYSTYPLKFNGRAAKLRVVDASVLKDRSRFAFLKGTDHPWVKMLQGGVFASESFSYRFGVDIGKELLLDTPNGKRSFPIVAIVRDYSSDQGTIHMDRAVYEQIWNDKRVQSVALFLKPAISASQVRADILQQFPGLHRTIASNTKMRSDILAIFDKTFAPTATLKGVSLFVALLGIATALMAILMERSREMTILSFLGLTPLELGKMNVYQALLMGFVSFLISVPCGLVLTYLVTNAINYRSFGWSIDMHLDPWIFIKSAFLTGLACVVSSAYPTYRLIRAQRKPILEEE